MKAAINSLALGMSFSTSLVAWTVIDPSNLTQNTLSVLRQIDQIEQTAARIKYEANAAQRLIEKMKDLKITRIRDVTGLINRFRTRTRSIGYTYSSVGNQFERIYGKFGDPAPKNHRAWRKQSDDSVKDAMESQALLEKSEKHMADLDQVVKVKNKSTGDSDTLQAIGEINTIQSKQLADLSQVVATDARARQSVIMEERAKKHELESYEAHLMKDFNEHRKSRPLTHFPSLGTTAPRR